MGKRETITPSTQQRREGETTRDAQRFGRMFRDVSGIRLGQADFQNLKNVKSLPHEISGRGGSELHSETDYPAIPNRTGLTCSKATVGGVATVTALVGTFLAGDIYGRYIKWTDDDTRDEIIGFTNATHVTVRRPGTKGATNCYIQGMPFGRIWHRKTRKMVYQIDYRLFWSDWEVTAYNEIYPQSHEVVSESLSKFFLYPDDDYVILQNAWGLFQIKINTSEPYFFLKNSPIQTTRITSNLETDINQIKSQYITCMAKMTGGIYTGNRIGDDDDDNRPILDIEQESGTNKANAEYEDWGTRFTEKYVGRGNETYGLIISGIGSSGYATGINKDIDFWRLLTGAGFRFNANNAGAQDIFVDLSNVDTLDDVCDRIRDGIRVYPHWAGATVEVHINPDNGYARFHISTGKLNGTLINPIGIDPIGSPIDLGLVDISGYDVATGCGLLCTTAEGGLIATADTDPNYFYTAPSQVVTLTPAPIENVTPVEPQRHWTHIPIYRTKNVGVGGRHPITGIGNSSEVYVWCEDVPIMKAFYASEAADGIITATIGVFQLSDVGNTLLYEDGTPSVIQYLCDAAGNEVYTPTSLYAIGNAGVVLLQTVVFGTATPMSMSKVGTTVTLWSGARNFAVTDVRKPIFWSDGTISWIISFTNITTVEVRDWGVRPFQGAAIDPTTRVYNDTILDEILDARLSSFYLANHRMFEPLPSKCDLCTVLQGFIVTAKRLEQTLYYSEMKGKREYRSGYYYLPNQYDNKCEDNIQELLRSPDRLTVICSHSTYDTNVDAPIPYKIPKFGFQIDLLPPVSIKDGAIGCVNTRSIKETQKGKVILITSEPSVRYYDKNGYGENLSKWQIEKDLKKLATICNAHYDDDTGYLVYGTEEE